MKANELSVLKIPLEFVSPQLQENIRTDDETRINLEEYIRTFKLGNIKHKKRVFTIKGDVREPAEPADEPEAS